MDWLSVFQACVLLVCAGSVLLMATVMWRWAASFETRLKRIDSLIGRLDSGTQTKRDSE